MKTGIARLFTSAAAIALLAGCSSLWPRAGAGKVGPQAYHCESGLQVTASYPDTGTARVNYRGRQLDMLLAVSASGARYVGSGLEWWTKGSGAGSDGLLLEHLPDGTSGDILERCTAS